MINNQKELIEEAELLENINKTLHGLVFPVDYRDYRFTEIIKTNNKDGGEQNWSGANYECSGVMDNKCKPVLDKIIIDAMRKYNIK